MRRQEILLLVLAAALLPLRSPAQAPHFDGARALATTRQFVSIGPRPVGSDGHRRAEAFLKQAFARDALEEDTFTAATPAGAFEMHNFIVRFAGKKDGVILLGTHYETNYPLRSTSFAGANDGGATTGLLIELARHLRGRTLDGYSVWLVFFDGEEAFESWSRADSTYGSRHLAARWQNDGTLKRIRGFLLADMLGDRDLNVDRDLNSTPWMVDLVKQAADHLHYGQYFFRRENAFEDDHLAFVQRGVPSVDVIDMDYGPHTAALPDGYHHTVEDTLDKLSARSLTIAGDVFLESVRLLNQR